MCASVCRRLLSANINVPEVARVAWRVHLVRNNDIAIALVLPVIFFKKPIHI
jgi:hypothetical protein